MIHIELARKIRRTEAAREAGALAGLPKLTTEGPHLALALGQVARLPSIAVPSPVVTDPSSPAFGKKRFILGISKLGGGDVML